MKGRLLTDALYNLLSRSIGQYFIIANCIDIFQCSKLRLPHAFNNSIAQIYITFRSTNNFINTP